MTFYGLNVLWYNQSFNVKISSGLFWYFENWTRPDFDEPYFLTAVFQFVINDLSE